MKNQIVDPGSFELPYSGALMARLAFATALLVATLITIPDALSILPSTSSVPAMVVRICGLWLSAFIQWQLVFLGILKALSLINGNVLVDGQSMRIARFRRAIGFDEIAAFTCEPAQGLFRLLPFMPPARRLTLFVEKKGKLVPRNLDSLLFDEADFEAFIRVIARKSFACPLDSPDVCLALRSEDSRPAAGQRSCNRKRKLYLAYVSMMLILFCGKTTLRNYLYNESAGDINEKQYAVARQKLEFITAMDPGFASGFDRLARVEFRQNDLEPAEKHWLHALKAKPDLVSAKVGLSTICMRRGELDRARALLNSARRLDPRHIPTLVNLGYYNLQTGRIDLARENFKKAVDLSGGDRDVCLIAASALKRFDSTHNREVLP
ncbi:MAG: tetratricopeptide repeat protein [Cyanobacteria bacterium HKST-UBA02]|nr:tetratricopeptide repeat protein [Cyanobacteria bacterium HKST-UBA02]